MAGCCDPSGYARMFDEQSARADAKRYRKGGLDPTARRMVEALVARGVAAATVLEVGGGIGAIQLHLLAAGAARSTNVEIVSSYETEAQELLRERGLVGRVERQVRDFARDGEGIGSADVVVLHRVVCCYPDMPALVRASAERTRRRLALSYPVDRWWTRLAIGLENLWQRVRGSSYRAYVHDPRAIVEEARAAGLRPVFEHGRLIWRISIFERSGSHP